MNRWKKKRSICHCYNCGYDIQISPDTVKETMIEGNIATYIECPVCGERMLKQLDTRETKKLAEKGVKLELLQRHGKKLSEKQKTRLKSIEKMLFNTRKQLKEQYWDEIYQSLNQYQEEKTGTADQGLVLGDEVTSTEKAGERVNGHEISV